MLFLGILLEGNSGVQARGGLGTTRGRLWKKKGLKILQLAGIRSKLDHEPGRQHLEERREHRVAKLHLREETLHKHDSKSLAERYNLVKHYVRNYWSMPKVLTMFVISWQYSLCST